jgi:hypothetical protein
MSPSSSIVSNIPVIEPTEDNKVSNAFDGIEMQQKAPVGGFGDVLGHSTGSDG